MFDDIEPMPERRVCPACGAGVGRRGDAAGALTSAHDRADQAMRIDVPNPCPGAGLPAMTIERFRAATPLTIGA